MSPIFFMEKEQKALYFEYVLTRLLSWYEDSNVNAQNDFSILKSIKLLFFVSAAGGNKERNRLIEEVFDNFVAMPYGHVESDVYDEIKIKNGRLSYFQIDNNRTTITQQFDRSVLDQSITSNIDDAISFLQQANPNLVHLSPFDLFDLSHAWYSWQKYYAMAKQQGQRSIFIPGNVIIGEDKIYSLNAF
jgi:uncharacterized phage-associated protein